MKAFQRAQNDPQSRLKILREYHNRFKRDPAWAGQCFPGEALTESEFMARTAEILEREFSRPVYLNDIYQVHLIECDKSPGWPPLVHLSIRRLDRGPIHDWRDLQEIKNQIIGQENEAVELYLVESRLVDTANQYHLFVLKDAAHRFPFGFSHRSVSEDEIAGSRQRPFGPGKRTSS